MTQPAPPQPDPDSSEPAVKVGAITAVVGAILAAAAAWGFNISAEQQAAVMTVTTILAPLVAAWITRNKVYSPATVAKLLSAKGR